MTCIGGTPAVRSRGPGRFQAAAHGLAFRRVLLSALCSLLAWGAMGTGAPAAEDAKLTRFKAVFVYNFIEYVRWPDAAESDVISLGILGDSPVAESLREISEKRKVKGKRLEVKVFPDATTLEPCEVLFVSQDHASELDSLRETLEARNVLLIGETEGLAAGGVAINFVLVKEKLRFEISQAALDRAGLVAGAQLMKLAILVDKKEAK